MHFDRGKRNGLDDIVERHTREAEAGRIDNRTINVVDVRLKSIDQDAFVIRLLDNQFNTEFRRDAPDVFIDEFKCFQAVNIRLTPPEKIGVWPVQNEEPEPARAIGRSIVSVHI